MDLQFLYSLIVGIFIGGVAGYLGSLMITKRMALVGDALGHAALPGIALALIYGFNPSWGAIPALFLGILVIWFFEMHTKLPMEALTGIVFTASVAIAFLFLPESQVSNALIGDISKISLSDTIFSVILSIIVFLILKKIFSKMILTSISEDVARVEHIDTKKYNFIYLVCIAIVVALGIKVTGSLLMGALVITPAAAARNMASNLFQYSFGALIIGVISCVLGILLFKVFSLPAGPFVILSATSIFLISLIFKKQ
ncbi:MAG TPA: metal ABC transporter permease [Candidatus Humimicrobiaceae bacterium]|nr:metal ABC transporter permease [Candidatus Humimicrobiaceae bacterium]